MYKAIVQYKSGKEGAFGSFFSESPSYSYMRLSSGGDSGRFQTSDYVSSSATHQVMPSSSSYGVQSSPRRRLNPRRASTTKTA